MSTLVYEFNRRKREIKQPTRAGVFLDTLEDVLASWQGASTSNKLNNLIIDYIPPNLRAPTGVDYINDLNALSKLEQKLNMRVVILYPGCTINNKIGWMVAFHLGKDIFTTPPDMVSEGYARAMCIALYTRFIFNLKSLNLGDIDD